MRLGHYSEAPRSGNWIRRIRGKTIIYSLDFAPLSGVRLCIKGALTGTSGKKLNRMSDSDPYCSTGHTTAAPHRRISQPPTLDPHEEVVELDFVCRRKSRSILNCTVVGRDGYTPYFHIMTGPESTLFRTNDGRTVAAIEWRGKGGAAHVEVHNAVIKQRVSQWLGVADDARQAICYVCNLGRNSIGC